jgi:hypothetical protein
VLDDSRGRALNHGRRGFGLMVHTPDPSAPAEPWTYVTEAAVEAGVLTLGDAHPLRGSHRRQHRGLGGPVFGSLAGAERGLLPDDRVGSGPVAASRRAASTPSMPGRLTSMKTRSADPCLNRSSSPQR